MACLTSILLLTLGTLALAVNSSSVSIFDRLIRDGRMWPQLVSSLVVASSLGAASADPSKFSFKPNAGASWNIELMNVPKAAQADDKDFHIWDFDMADAPKSLIETFHAKGHPVICYFSAGSWEKWRQDADQSPKAALGEVMDGWTNERWVDTRNSGVRALMKKRIEQAAAKGCDGVDPDNIDGYENDTGFKLTRDDGVDYARFLAETAHDAGMAFGLKNGGAIVKGVVDVSERCVNEQCVKYNECELYQPFIKEGKPVFHIEYTAKDPAPAEVVSKACSNSKAKGFSTIIKHLNLNAWTTTCP